MPEESEPFVILENVCKKFDGTTVLEDISATINVQEVLGLIGRSGAGKSVLIHMLRGSPDYKPDSGRVVYRVNRCESCGWIDLPSHNSICSKCGGEMGTVEIDFWELDNRDPRLNEIRSRISIMLQRTFALYGEMSVIENIFEALGKDVDENEKVDRAIQLLEMVNLTHRTTHIARDLSGGEKQRCVLARQLAKDPILFLADEPTGTLDPQTAELVHDALVNAVKTEKMAMVVTSHWPKAIRKMADRAIWLRDGKKIDEGDPDRITEEFMEDYDLSKQEEVEVGEPMVKVRDAKKYFYSISRGVVKAVDHVSFDINEREIFGLVGISGAGKTTLSKMISGMMDAKIVAGSINEDLEIEADSGPRGTSGNGEKGTFVRIGDDWVNMAEYGPLGRGRATPYIQMLHQEYSLYPFDTVLENLTTCIGIKMPAELAKMKAIQVLKGVGFSPKKVEQILYSYPDALSVGEKQRVALAQVLIREPRLVILDEPTGTMDPITKMDVVESIKSAREELGETFLIVSHDMDFVLSCCDRAALMKEGKIAAIGDPEDIVGHLTEKEEEIMLGGGVEA